MNTQKSSSGFPGNITELLPLGVVVFAILGFFMMSGSGPDTTPLMNIRHHYKDQKDFSVVLVDAKEEGNFFNDYYQKFQIIFPGEEAGEPRIHDTEWMQTTDNDFENLLPFIGMTVFAKKGGVETDEANPPGYEFVGDERYGEWRSHHTGGLFWYWLPTYMFWSSRYGTGAIYRTDYDTYQQRRKAGQPYFGKNNQYGTNGSLTKNKYPSFYERHNSKNLQKRASFDKKVQSKIGRNSVAVRSRSGGVGK